MSITREQAQEAVDVFKAEFKGLTGLRYVLLETERDFHDHYGKNAPDAIAAWAGNLAAFDRPTGTVVLSLAAHHEAGEFRESLRHEAIGHYGINTFDAREKRALLDAIVAAKDRPGSLAMAWQFVEAAYPARSRDEQAEELFALSAETTSRQRYRPGVFERVWNEAVERRDRPLRETDLHAIAGYVTEGLRQNTRTQKIFPATNDDQFRSGHMPNGRAGAFQRAILGNSAERAQATKALTAGQPSAQPPATATPRPRRDRGQGY